MSRMSSAKHLMYLILKQKLLSFSTFTGEEAEAQRA